MFFIQKVFEKIFKTIYWKLTVVCLLLVLVYSLVRIFQILDYLYNYYRSVAGGARFANLLDDVYTWGIVGTVLLVMIVVAGFIDLFSFIRLTKRFRAITTVINNIASGDIRQRVAIKSKDEIGQLAKTFNRMADTIVFNIDQLRATDNLRRELVANVAHDLGGPVTSIQGYVETILMKDTRLSLDERKQFLEVILANAKTLSKLVAELFDLSKFDAHHVVPQKEKFSVVTLAGDIASRFQPRADQKQIRLEVYKDQFIPLVFADLTLMERVLSNILDNAINYTNKGGQVCISFEVEEKRVKVIVSDTGIGIEKKDLPLLFERFYRVSKDRSRTTGGAGLGLAIVKNILDAHDSEVFVDSTPGEGTTICFWLLRDRPDEVQYNYG
jgi:signal transduction histidine kinase